MHSKFGCHAVIFKWVWISYKSILVYINNHPCKNFTEISQSRRDRRDLGELAMILARFQNIAPRKVARGEIARSARSRRDNHHLGDISKYRVEISTPRQSRNAISPHQTRSWRDNRDLGAISKYHAEISSENEKLVRQTSLRRDSHNLGVDSRDLGDFMSRFLLLQRRDCLDLCEI